VGRIAGYNTREVACTAHVCLCPLVFALSVDTDKNESCFWMCRITMCQRDYHMLLFTACWLWYPACAGVDACLFPFNIRAVFQPARSCSVWKLEAVVAQVEYSSHLQTSPGMGSSSRCSSHCVQSALGAWQSLSIHNIPAQRLCSCAIC
jgi:hypothetical protein